MLLDTLRILAITVSAVAVTLQTVAFALYGWMTKLFCPVHTLHFVRQAIKLLH